MEPLVHTKESAKSNISFLNLDDCSPLPSLKEPPTENFNLNEHLESIEELVESQPAVCRNSSYICRNSSINLIQDMVWSKQVGNIDLFKSQQIFYRLFQKSQYKSASFHSIR